jgi:hypothetical protein
MAETSKQVGMMAQIYSQTDLVNVWLGLAADDSDAVISRFETNGASAQAAGLLDISLIEDHKIRGSRMPGASPLESRLVAIRDAVDALSDQLGDDTPDDALYAFLSRPYWSRVWVLQEFVVGGICESYVGRLAPLYAPRCWSAV